MNDIISLTTLRTNLYNMFDMMLKTGNPLNVSRGGTVFQLHVTPVDQPLQQAKKKTISKLSKITPRKGFLGDPDGIIDLRTWEWGEDT